MDVPSNSLDTSLLIFGGGAAFFAVTLLSYTLIQILARGVRSYEEKYVAGAHRTLDAMYLTMTPQQILYLSLLCTLAIGLLVGVSTLNPIVGAIAGCMALGAPYCVIRLLKRRRDKRFGIQLVDALIAMGNALRAGHSLPAALELIAREVENPLGQEMRLVVQEMRIGVTMEDALRHLHRRMPSEDLDILITSILISRELGGNLAEIFDNIAHTIRERHRIEGKVDALTAQGKLQGAIIAALPILIGLFLHMTSPALMQGMLHDWVGWLLIGIIIIMETLGVYSIWRIVSIRI